jgi:hypothetical protein
MFRWFRKKPTKSQPELRQDLVQVLANVRTKAEQNVHNRCVFAALSTIFLDRISQNLLLKKDYMALKLLHKSDWIIEFRDNLYNRATIYQLVGVSKPKR